MSDTITIDDYPKQGQRWRHIRTDERVEITYCGDPGSTWFKYPARETETSGRAGHSAFLPGLEQRFVREV